MAVEGLGISKSFAGLRVLDGVDITVEDGKVHALLGANGSGKSTLVKILSGVYQPDEGTIRIGGRSLGAIASPYEANELGIAVVHQEAPLIDTMTVAEGIAMFRGYPTDAIGRVRWRKVNEDAAALLEAYGIAVSPGVLAGKLRPAERALVALVIALDRVASGLQLLILDEVTASLPEDEASVYLQRVGEIAASGIAVLMVTHRLAELRGLAHSVTILRDGRVAYSGSANDVGEQAIVTHMVGLRKEGATRSSGGYSGAVRRLWRANAREDDIRPSGGDGRTALSVEHLRGELLVDVNFDVARGEIVGVAGLADSGITELPNILAGILPRRGGEIRIDGSALAAGAEPGDAIDAGLVLLPADRLRNGGIGTLSVADNTLLPQVSRFWHRSKRASAVLDSVISELDVRPPSSTVLFGKLSGGNQQKTILGKWLLTRPTALVLDDPTSGVDPGAREKIFEILRDAAHEGVGILFFSTEPEQLAAMCSRVIILKGGMIATELSGSDLNRETISQWCYA